MDQIDRLYPQQEAGFLRALLMGDKSGLEDIDQNHFNRVGLGHVVVISGFHVSVLMGFLALFLNPKKKRNVAVILLVLVAFCCMTGSDPGTVRATVLCALAMLAPLVGRSYDSITGLCAALLLLLAIVLRCIQVGMKSPDYMNRLICIGIASMLLFQILINVGVCLGLFPVVGLALSVFELRRQLHPDVVPRHGHRLRHTKSPPPPPI